MQSVAQKNKIIKITHIEGYTINEIVFPCFCGKQKITSKKHKHKKKKKKK